MLNLLILLVASYLFWAWLNRRRSNEPPVYPGAWPIIGHLHLFLGDDLHLWKLAKTVTSKCMEMGHACFLYIGHIKIYTANLYKAPRPPIYGSIFPAVGLHQSFFLTGLGRFLNLYQLLTDPDDISKIANTCYEKDSFSRTFTEDLLKSSLMFSPVSIWKRHRKLLNPTLNQQILDGFMPIFNSEARRLVKELAVKANGEPFDQTNCVRQHFMKTICLTALDDAISEEDAKNYVKCLDTYFYCYITRFQRFWLHSDFLYQFTDLKKKQDASTKALQDICDAVLQRKRAQREQNKYEINEENSGRKVKTFIDLVMDLTDGELTDHEIRDEMNIMIIGGHETTASVTISALLLIGSYPEIQDKLFKELQNVFGSTDRDVKKQDLTKLVYLEAVLKETMRYYETGPLIARYIDQEVKLKNCTLQPGHNCFLMLRGVHRSPMWGPDVDDFKPERWLHPDTLPKNPNAFVAFSLGRRDCIGKRYAMMSLKTMLSHILRRYKIRSDHTKLILKLDVLLKHATGHEICIEDRLKL